MTSTRDNSTYWYIGGAILLTILLCIGISSCNPRPSYGTSYPVPVSAAPAAPAAAPVIVQGGGHSNTASDMITGGLLGYMIGSAGNRNQSTVTHQTITTTAPAQRYAPAPTYRPSTTWGSSRPSPTIRPSTSTNSRNVTTTTTSRSTSFGTRR